MRDFQRIFRLSNPAIRTLFRLLQTMKLAGSSSHLKLVFGIWLLLGGSSLTSGELASITTVERSPVSVELIATGVLPATQTDFSTQASPLEEGTPSNQAGGFSAIEYSGAGNFYWLLSDRGPADGAASFQCRIQEIELTIDREKQLLQTRLCKTILLTDEQQKPFVGALSALPSQGYHRQQAFDPEGLRRHPAGGFIISDEYGPTVEGYSAAGHRFQAWRLPEWMSLTRESKLSQATLGTMPNRGLEGLAITKDGRSLMAAMQGPLVQDSEVHEDKGFANYTRLIQLSVERLSVESQFVYPLDHPSSGVSEILEFGENEYLVLERDGARRPEAGLKAIYQVNLADATNVSDQPQLPAWSLPESIKPATKKLFINLLDPELHISDEHKLEKPEGLTWGPMLADGRRLLIVCFDNDFDDETDSLFLAFAISEAN
jgi:hypothetical protein